MRIALLNSLDHGGGAAGIARNLAEALRQRGHEVALVVGLKRTSESWVHEVRVPGQGSTAEALVQRSLKLLKRGAPQAKLHQWTRRALQSFEARSVWNQFRGREDYALRASSRIFDQIGFEPDVIHLHNLHVFVGKTHFDLRALPALSRGKRLVFTLHDTWAFTGHCGYFFSCERWRMGCGNCPDLAMYPAIRRDTTAQNLQFRADAYSKLNYTLTGPSAWVVNCARDSVLAKGMRAHQVVPNGIDLNFFSPASSYSEARRKLGLADDEHGIAFISDLGRDTPYRDYSFMERLAERYEQSGRTDKLVVFEVGGAAGERQGKRIRYVGTGVLGREGVRAVLRGAAALFHPAKTDNFPTVILEALACGTPAVGSAVGGIPEQIEPGVDGFLYPSGDLEAAWRALEVLLADANAARAFRVAARRNAEKKFAQDLMVDAYERIYQNDRMLGEVGER